MRIKSRRARKAYREIALVLWTVGILCLYFAARSAFDGRARDAVEAVAPGLIVLALAVFTTRRWLSAP